MPYLASNASNWERHYRTVGQGKKQKQKQKRDECFDRFVSINYSEIWRTRKSWEGRDESWCISRIWNRWNNRGKRSAQPTRSVLCQLKSVPHYHFKNGERCKDESSVMCRGINYKRPTLPRLFWGFPREHVSWLMPQKRRDEDASRWNAKKNRAGTYARGGNRK